jgi:hypothetical protein
MEAAKDQLTAARGICPDGPADLPGAIGRAVLATLLPARRPRYSARKVKCATSRYLNRDDGRPAHPTTITAIDIAICTPPVDLKPGRTHRDRRSTPRSTQPPTRRERITAIITGQPPRDWSGHELAILLGVKPRNMLTQLGEWARLGFFTRTASAPTNSTRRQRAPPRQTRPTFNFAALITKVTPKAPLTGSGCREYSYGGFGGGHPHFLLHAPDLLIRRSGQIVQDSPSPVVRWAVIPQLSAPVSRRPVSW